MVKYVPHYYEPTNQEGWTQLAFADILNTNTSASGRFNKSGTEDRFKCFVSADGDEDPDFGRWGSRFFAKLLFGVYDSHVVPRGYTLTGIGIAKTGFHPHIRITASKGTSHKVAFVSDQPRKLMRALFYAVTEGTLEWQPDKYKS